MAMRGILVAVACAVVMGGCKGGPEEAQGECTDYEMRECVPEFINPHCDGYLQYCYHGTWGPCECSGVTDPPEVNDAGEVPSDPLPDFTEIPTDVPGDPLLDPQDVTTDLPDDESTDSDPNDPDAEDVEGEG
jgi:hypothetical protein